MKQRSVQVILTVPYFDPRHARFVAQATNAVIVPMAHNPGSRDGTDTYLELIRYNAETLLKTLETTRAK